MRLPESLAYLKTLALIRGWSLDLDVPFKEKSTYSMFICDEIVAELTDGRCFEYYSRDNLITIVHNLDQGVRNKEIHPDSFRVFEEDCHVFVRRPNCTHCKELWANHAPGGKCLFESTSYDHN